LMATFSSAMCVPFEVPIDHLFLLEYSFWLNSLCSAKVGGTSGLVKRNRNDPVTFPPKTTMISIRTSRMLL
jgi:hypothetical protein